MKKCTICGKPIILVPSAKERATKYGESAAYYTALFTTHAQCAIDERERETQDLIQRLSTNSKH